MLNLLPNNSQGWRHGWLVAVALNVTFLASYPTAAAVPPVVEVLKSFGFSEGTSSSPPLRDSAGNLYGTTVRGGTGGAGTVYRIAADGTYSILHSFVGSDGSAPVSSPVQGSDGSLYGTTNTGGTFNAGTLYRIDPNGEFRTLHSFNTVNGSSPLTGPTLGPDNSVYGTASAGGEANGGVIYKFSSTGVFSVLHSFKTTDGTAPLGGVTLFADGRLIGATTQGGANGWGTIYQITPAGTFSILQDLTFGRADSTLVPDADGNLYGTTSGSSGNTDNFKGGTVFKLARDNTLTVLHQFGFLSGSGPEQPQGPLVLDSAGTLYGTSRAGGSIRRGAVFRLTTAGDFSLLYSVAPETQPAQGAVPLAGVSLGANGLLYGTFSRFGQQNAGTVFQIDPASGAFAVVHAFLGAVDGISPDGIAVDAAGNVYGLALDGTSSGSLLYKRDTAGNYTVLHRFAGAARSEIAILGAGRIYVANGTTQYIFNTVGQILQSFARPANSSGLALGSDGSIYGTILADDGHPLGAVFKTDPAGVTSTLHSFNDSFGSFPATGILLGRDSQLYGTVGVGVYKLDPVSTTFSPLHTFTPPAEASRLTQSADGSLFGTTRQGGDNGLGVVYRLDPAGNFTVLHSFVATDGANPALPVTVTADGQVFGTTQDDGAGNSARIFSISPGGEFTTVQALSDAPLSGLVAGPDGNVYGTTRLGGTFSSGTLFRIRLDSSSSGTVTIEGAVDQTLEASDATGAIAQFAPTATTETGAAVAVNCTPASGSRFPLGETQVNCSAQSGTAAASASFKIVVRDTTPPVLRLPGNLTSSAATVSFNATASDRVSGTVPVSCSPVSGSTFPVGQTTVRCQASDTAGNKAEGSFVVTVTARNNAPVARDDTYGNDPNKPIVANKERSQSIEVNEANGVLANDLPRKSNDRQALLVSGPVRTAGSGTATMRLRLDADGEFRLRLDAPRTASTDAQRQAAKRGTYKFTYSVTSGGLKSAPATVTITVR